MWDTQKLFALSTSMAFNCIDLQAAERHKRDSSQVCNIHTIVQYGVVCINVLLFDCSV